MLVRQFPNNLEAGDEIQPEDLYRLDRAHRGCEPTLAHSCANCRGMPLPEQELFRRRLDLLAALSDVELPHRGDANDLDHCYGSGHQSLVFGTGRFKISSKGDRNRFTESVASCAAGRRSSEMLPVQRSNLL